MPARGRGVGRAADGGAAGGAATRAVRAGATIALGGTGAGAGAGTGATGLALPSSDPARSLSAGVFMTGDGCPIESIARVSRFASARSAARAESAAMSSRVLTGASRLHAPSPISASANPYRTICISLRCLANTQPRRYSIHDETTQNPKRILFERVGCRTGNRIGMCECAKGNGRSGPTGNYDGLPRSPRRKIDNGV